MYAFGAITDQSGDLLMTGTEEGDLLISPLPKQDYVKELKGELGAGVVFLMILAVLGFIVLGIGWAGLSGAF